MTNKELQKYLKNFPDEAVIWKYEDGCYDAYTEVFSLSYKKLKSQETISYGELDERYYPHGDTDPQKVKTIIL